MNYKAGKKPITVPDNAQWLGGVGAGSWFVITEVNNFFSISRYSKLGDPECSGNFICSPRGLDLTQEFKFTYLSHCKLCTIIQAEITYTLSISAS